MKRPLSTTAGWAISVTGGPAAPRVARSAVLRRLEGRLTAAQAEDVRLIVSELVTNSVRHASVDTTGEITIELLVLQGRLRLGVSDPGSRRVPRRLPPDPERPGGIGLRVVERLATSWGVARDGVGTTMVWCELAL